MPGEELYFQVKYDLAFFDEELVGSILATFREVLQAVGEAHLEDSAGAGGTDDRARPLG